MEYTILILLFPLLSFLAVGLLGTKLKPVTAGLVGTISLVLVTLLSYFTALQYFSGHNVNGVWETLIPYNFTWLNLGLTCTLIWAC